jgi:uncharacterized alkaline shock family protein YloU
MKLIDKFLLFILLIVLLTTILMSLSVFLGVVPFGSLEDTLAGLTYNPIAIGIAALGLIVTVVVMARALVAGKNTKPKQAFCLVKNTEIGTIQVSMSTLDALTNKAVMSFQQVKDVRSIIGIQEEALTIKVRILVMPSAILPELTQQIQANVKEYIETTAGVNVSNVMIYVDNIYTAAKTKL